MHAFYEKKKKEGKPKMSALNAVQNKLVRLMFALVRDSQEFNEKHEHKLAR